MTALSDPAQPANPMAHATSSATTPSISLVTIIILTVGFRFAALFLVRYGGATPDFSDFRYYHELASLSAQGYFPGIQFWSEYPPVFPWIAVAVYRVTLALPTWIQPYFWFDLFLSTVLALADVGCIWSIDRIGDSMGGRGWGRRSAVVYAALFAPAYAVLGWFDTLPTFFLLAGLAAIVGQGNRSGPLDGLGGTSTRRGSLLRWIVAGFAVGIGVMVKLFPIVNIPASFVMSEKNRLDEAGSRELRVQRYRSFLLTLGSAIATCLALSAPFLLTNPATFLATFRNVTARGSWESPWALLDGYFGTGGVASLADRLYFNGSAAWGTPVRYPIVWWFALLVTAAFYTYRFRVALAVHSPSAAVALTALGTTLLLLLSRGFSQQFIVWIMPFIALLMPGPVGAFLAVILALDTLVLEGYLFVGLFPSVHELLWVSVAVRTAILLWLAVEFSLAIDPAAPTVFLAWRRRAARGASVVFAAIMVVLVVEICPSVATAARLRFGDGTIRIMFADVPAAAVVVFTQPPLYDRLAGDVGGRPTLLVAEPRLLTWTGDRSLNAQLDRAVGSKRNVVIVGDAIQPTSSLIDATQRWLLVRYGPPIVRESSSIRMWVYDQSKRPIERPLDLGFRDGPRLVGVSLGASTIHLGSALVVSLHWHADRAIGKDFTVSTQLLDQEGRLVAQHDSMPVDNTLPMTGWQAGDNVFDPVTLSVPIGTAPGEFQLLVTLYDHETMLRLDVTGPGSAGDHAIVGAVTVAP